MNFSQDTSIIQDKSQLQQILVETRQTLSEIRQHELLLKDELESTKTKLRMTESQLQNAPRWMSADIESSEIQFLKARNKVEIEALQTKLLEKDKEIEKLKKELIPRSFPSLFIQTAINSIEFFSQNQYILKYAKTNSQFSILLQKFQNFSSSNYSIDTLLHEIQNLIELLITTSNETFESFEHEVIFANESTHVNQINQTNQIKQLETELSEMMAKNMKLQNEMSNIRNDYLFLTNRLLGYSSSQADYKKINSSVDKLLRFKDENDKIKQSIALLQKQILDSSQEISINIIFERILDKFKEYQNGYRRISKAFNLHDSNTNDLINKILEKHTSLQLETSELSKTYDKLAKSANSMRDQIKLLQNQLKNREKESIIVQSEVEKQITTKQMKIDTLENKLSDLLQKSNEIRINFEQSLREIEDSNKYAITSRKEILDLTEENKNLKHQIELMETRLKSYSTQSDKISSYEKQISGLQQTINSLTNQIEILQNTKIENNYNVELNLKRENEEQKDKIAKNQKIISDMKIKIQDLNIKIGQYDKNISDLKQKLSEQKNDFEKLQRETIHKYQNLIIESQNKESQKYKIELEAAADEMKESQSIMRKFAEKVEKQNRKIKNLNQVIDQMKNESFNESKINGVLKEKIEQLNKEKREDIQNITTLKLQNSELKKKLELNERNDTSKANEFILKVKSLELELESIKNENNSYKMTIENYKSKLNDYEIKSLHQKVMALETELSLERKKFTSLQTQFSSLCKENEKNILMINDLKKKISNFQQESSRLSLFEQNMNEKVESMQKKLELAEGNLSTSEKALATLSELVKTAKIELIRYNKSEIDAENSLSNLFGIFGITNQRIKSLIVNKPNTINKKPVRTSHGIAGNASDLFVRLNTLCNQVENETENISIILQNSTIQ